MLRAENYTCPDALFRLCSATRALPAAVVWPTSEQTFQSVGLATKLGLIEPVYVGRSSSIEEASASGRDREVVPAESESDAAITAVKMVRGGRVALLIKGDVHTDVLMRAVVSTTDGIRSKRRLSHAFYLSVPDSDQRLIITDAALNVAPDIDARISILENSVRAFRSVGLRRPKVAVLSATEVVTASIQSSLDAKAIVDKVRGGAIEDLDIEGPLALDLAISPAAASQKGISGAVPGHADILLVPNIETGNALYKSLVYFRGATAAGIVLGASVPIALTSRADPPEARLTSIALASIIAVYD